MRCPECGADVAARLALCPSCDHVLDPSAFSSTPPADQTYTGDEDTPPHGSPSPDGRSSAAPAGGGKPGHDDATRITEAPSSRPDSPAPRAARTAKFAPPASADSDDGWRDAPTPVRPAARISDEARPVVRPAVETRPGTRASDDIGAGYAPAEDLATELKFLIRGLSGRDKLAFWGAAITFFAGFFPWRQTAREGDVLGIVSLGAGVMLLGLGCCAALAVRERDLLPRTSPTTLWGAQLACAALAPLLTLVCIKLSWNSTLVPASVGLENIWTSKPGIGAWAALPASVVALLGTLLGMKGKS